MGAAALKSVPDPSRAKAEIARQQAVTVRGYLEALRAKPSGPGRKRDANSVQQILDRVEAKLASKGDVLSELELLQQRRDLRAELAHLKAQPTIEQFEDRFVEIAFDYSERKGLCYETWREVGVPATVLERAGIAR